MVKVSIFGSERSFLEKDMSVMSSHLEKVLNEIDGVLAEREVLTKTSLPDFSQPRDVLVFCGYDHLTLSAIHLALDSGQKIILFDEPGKSVEREVNSLLFSGMDQGRIPPTSLSSITHSWTYRDITGVVHTLLRHESRESAETNSSGPDRTRQVENTRKASPRKRTRGAEDTNDKAEAVPVVV